MLTLVLITITILTFILILNSKPANCPPGPPRLPLIGSLPFLMERDFRKTSLLSMATNLVQNYGPICTFFIGMNRYTLISDFALIKEILKSDHAIDRPDLHLIFDARPGGRKLSPSLGLLFSSGRGWAEQRRVVSRHLKDLGFGKSSMEPMLKHEVAKLIQHIQNNKGMQFSIQYTFNVSILNALWLIICGKSYELDDPKLMTIVDVINKFIKNSATSNPLVILLPSPNLAKLPLIRSLCQIDVIYDLFSEMDALFDEEVKRHMENWESGTENDLVDVLVQKVKETDDESSQFHGETGLLAIKSIMMDLFMAGTETTSNSLVWSFLFLLHHPDVQEKIHDEIERVVGHDRMVNLSDRPNMHYVNAFMDETLRCSVIVPLNAPHCNSQPLQLGAYVIPAQTEILTNLYHIMHDPEYWRNPDTFSPERFLDSNGVFHHDERVIPFSLGKRVCLGQTLAEMEFFLFLVSLLQTFNVKNPIGQILPSYRVKDQVIKGVARSSPNFDIIMEPRA